MDELGLFTAALGMSGPWRVTRSEFDAEATQLDLYLDFDRGARFACPAKDCAQGCCPVHDSVDKTWRHLDFFQHKALVLSFAAAMPMAKVAGMTREHDTRIWRIVEHHVTAARDQLDCSGVRRVGMDETSAAKGQDYISIFADLMPGGWSSPPRDVRRTPWPASPLIWSSTGATRPRSLTPAPT